ncbi:speriolin-like protein isoform X1 [Kryptolebias marmoratus]|uniref:speriolin-like protein isoform X1 n=1 Tax=Kryptolebias marmoratus TaxID=37003 RepID=UPI000D530971|nr:speriolin-like protein isoform X1 [Kryptolebias marmoratus]
MDLEESAAALQAENHHLAQENDQLRTMLGLLRENVDLKARMQSRHLDDTLAPGTRQSNLWQHTFDERQFRRDLRRSKSRPEPRTSSPVDFKSFLQSSAPRDADETAELRADAPLCVAAQPRLLGEIVYQLDRRILSHVFQAHKRLYGFTLLNIPEKIIEVSTHPLTGKVDEGYQLHLTQRYTDLMDKLSQLGYKAALHPPFCEFVVNAYGILRERPSQNCAEAEYNNPDFLRRLIATAAPKRLQKDLSLVLACLCSMAAQDRRPLLLW